MTSEVPILVSVKVFSDTGYQSEQLLLKDKAFSVGLYVFQKMLGIRYVLFS